MDRVMNEEVRRRAGIGGSVCMKYVSSLFNSDFITPVHPVSQVFYCLIYYFIVSFTLRFYFVIETSQILISNYRIKISAFLLAMPIMCKSIRIYARHRVSYLYFYLIPRQSVLRKSLLNVCCRINIVMNVKC